MRKFGSIPWYAGIEEIKAITGITVSVKNDRIAILTGAISRFIERYTGRVFYPTTGQRKFDYQDPHWLEFLNDDLLSLTEVLDNGGNGTINLSHLFYEPPNRKPYYAIHLNPANDNFTYEYVRNQALWLTGEWGFSEDTVVCEVNSPASFNSSATTMALANGSAVDVGWTLLIDSERLFVEDVDAVDSDVNIGADIAIYGDEITLAPATFYVGEVIKINNEEMKIVAKRTTTMEVIRNYNGTTIAAHTSGDDVYVYRSFTVRRAQFGSTAAAHNNIAISRYVPPEDVVMACAVLVARAEKRAESGWSDRIGSQEAGYLFFSKSMPIEIAAVLGQYMRVGFVAV